MISQVICNANLALCQLTPFITLIVRSPYEIDQKCRHTTPAI
jgi:hypothetical protein